MIASHGLERPTPNELVSSLGQVLPAPEVQSVLSRACDELELGASPFDELELDELARLTHKLTRQRGLVSIIARAYLIRLDSYIHLAQVPRA